MIAVGEKSLIGDKFLPNRLKLAREMERKGVVVKDVVKREYAWFFSGFI